MSNNGNMLLGARYLKLKCLGIELSPREWQISYVVLTIYHFLKDHIDIILGPEAFINLK